MPVSVRRSTTSRRSAGATVTEVAAWVWAAATAPPAVQQDKGEDRGDPSTSRLTGRVVRLRKAPRAPIIGAWLFGLTTDGEGVRRSISSVGG